MNTNFVGKGKAFEAPALPSISLPEGGKSASGFKLCGFILPILAVT